MIRRDFLEEDNAHINRKNLKCFIFSSFIEEDTTESKSNSPFF